MIKMLSDCRTAMCVFFSFWESQADGNSDRVYSETENCWLPDRHFLESLLSEYITTITKEYV